MLVPHLEGRLTDSLHGSEIYIIQFNIAKIGHTLDSHY